LQPLLPALVGDIGGTYARFAVATAENPETRLIGRFETRAYASPEEALVGLLGRAGVHDLRAAVLGCAGPLSASGIRLTNGPWTIDPARIGDALGFDRVTVLNDFTPLAAAASSFDPPFADSLLRVGPVATGDGGPRLVCGPGTGFGAAVLRRSPTLFLLEETEAGHVDFGPVSEDEFALWPYLERVEGRVTVETLVSGAGLGRLDLALRRMRDLPAADRSPARVLGDAAAGEPTASEAVGLFGRLLGRAAGDLALVFKATGGVFLVGGMIRRVLDRLDEGTFRAAFEAKAPFDGFMRSIPTYAVIATDPALAGAALIARAPVAFTFEGRVWERRG